MGQTWQPGVTCVREAAEVVNERAETSKGTKPEGASDSHETEIRWRGVVEGGT